MSDQNTISMAGFGLLPNSEVDASPAVLAAVKSIQLPGAKVLFETGTYHFYPGRAREKYLFVSNNDDGLKRIAFPLCDLSDIEIDGQGSVFIFHGSITPFAVLDCKNVILRNFTIDWHTPFNAETVVQQVGVTDSQNRTSIDLSIPVDYPYVIERNQLYFVDDTGLKEKPTHSLEFDIKKRETAFGVKDNWSHGDYHFAEELSERLVRFTSEFAALPQTGNILSLVHTGRDCSAVVVSDCVDVRLFDVVVRHAGGMGLIAQRTRNVRVERMTVAPAPNVNRLVSTTADATHFVNCAGLIEIVDCLFQGQLDDATNIHGIYSRVSRVLSRDKIEVELVHGQQAGIHITHAGDEIEFVCNGNLLRYHTGKVAATEIVNRRYSILTLESPLPDQVKVGDVVASLTWSPDAIIRGNKALKNRARGFLVSTSGKVVIEDNYIHVPGAGILIAGDANYWFEAGSVRDITIRHNHFDNCNYGVWGAGAIEICPEIEQVNRTHGYYHSGIDVEHNTFNIFDMRLVTACSVDGFTFKDNIVELSVEYPNRGGSKPLFRITDSRDILIDNIAPALELVESARN